MTTITGVRAVSIPVGNQDRSLEFCVGAFDRTEDHSARGDLLIRFGNPDLEAAHASIQAARADVDQTHHSPGTRSMFAVGDPDGNALSLTETAGRSRRGGPRDN
jgi:predicted enzyme related to lactoylglutathione lyase